MTGKTAHKVDGRAARRIGLTSIAIVGAAAIGWAGATVFSPPKDPAGEADFVLVDVVQGEVGSGIALNTVAEWKPVPVGTNAAAGVVTSVTVEQGQKVSTGAVLFTVNLRPVVIAQGAVPGFRPLSQGDDGADVAQLQSLLHSLGYLSAAPDAKFGWVTQRAVRAWQRESGVEVDGVVQPGDVIYVPDLPARVALDVEVVNRGARIGGGEMVVSVLPAAPVFSIPVTANQSSAIPDFTPVEISAPGGSVWPALVDDRVENADGDLSLILAPGEGNDAICGELCAEVPVTGQSLLPSQVEIVQLESGLVVPTAALMTEPGGAVVLVDEDGTRHSVKVVASADGMSVVVGVEAGLKVRLPPESE